MIAVIFEVWPADGRKDDYLAMAAALRADLDTMDGFISIERFQSLTIRPSCCLFRSGAMKNRSRRGATMQTIATARWPASAAFFSTIGCGSPM